MFWVYTHNYYLTIKFCMPNFDKTGPEGKGPMGMRRGGCKRVSSVNSVSPRLGRCQSAQRSKPSLGEEEKELLARLEEVRKVKRNIGSE